MRPPTPAVAPVIALLGRPNVGKSTLFNRLTKTRAAIVADVAGLTRDRQYGHAAIDGRSFIVIDTGGLATAADPDDVDALTQQQSLQAAEEADMVLFIVDGRQGPNAEDDHIARRLRRLGKPVLLLVNKTDATNPDTAVADFYRLGQGDPLPIAAAHGRGLARLASELNRRFPAAPPAVWQADDQGMILAVVGRPNTGKSTLINKWLGETRQIVFDAPGTTRDSVFIPFRHADMDITLIDTAGVRRRARVNETVEKFSAVKTLQAIDRANAVVLLLDGREGVVEQDATLLGNILQRGRALVIAVNKWDRLPAAQRATVKRQLEVKLAFADFAPLCFISALHGTGVSGALNLAAAAYRAAYRRFTTAELNRLLQDMLSTHQPPPTRGRAPKLRYMHQGGCNPPRFIIHGNAVDHIADNYRRFLGNHLRRSLRLTGAPIQLEFKNSDNPYHGRKNKLTPRQQKKRARLIQHRRRR